MVRLVGFWSDLVLWINLWKLWIAQSLLCCGRPEEALRATIAPRRGPVNKLIVPATNDVEFSFAPVSH